ncbi:efflux transporter outer membrane subunit [Hydrogenophaga sp. PAMC20947]|uniref:efflux transporter outer membrane subunit n=1 Tax=Hydrogenophaga sp. PAMC20947 TaxID=2565558 RepID=UPI00109D9023|nr:efflux transporter outer membrane subunit [Hydrogenophaga sp. PAMC20947]QCB46156.1 efflux transporter outer membrane subunit [Hydrogenophaga sp. PAMC20947]
MKPYQSNANLRRSGATWALSAVAALVLTACASSAGISSSAHTIEPAQLGLIGATAPANGSVQAQWWEAWGDPALTALVGQALAAHPSLQVVEARLAKASAAVAAEGGNAGPKLQFSADATRQRFSATSIYPAPLGGSTQTLANAQFAGSWEIDFFGRHRAAIDAALGGQRAAQADAAAARNLLASQVGQTYVQFGRLLAQRTVAERALAQREQMLGLIRQRVDAGLDTQVELRQGEGALPEARQSIEQINELIDNTRNALAALAAVPAESLAALKPALSNERLLVVPESVPANLLGTRPDIEAARWRIEAATQGITAAKAQFYPNVNLTAFAGLSSIGLGNLVEAGSRQMGVGPAIHLPIFDSGSLRANLSNKTADLDSAVAAYNGAVLDAVRETADQLNTLQSLARQRAEQAQAQRAVEEAYAFAQQRYGAGLSGYLTLLNAENAVLAQRRQAVDLHARALSAQVGLVRALGGGYQPDPVPGTLARVASAPSQ